VTGGLNLDYGTATGNPNGWDDLGRIDDQRWQSDASVIKDRYQYGYDRTSNRTFRDNLTGTGKDHFYGYSGLDQVTTSKQGDLNSGRTEITGTPGFQEAWTLESHGNWRGLTQTTSGTPTLNQSRTHTKANEVTMIGATVGANWGDGVVDRNGFMTRVPKPGNEAQLWELTSDAWLRVVMEIRFVFPKTTAGCIVTFQPNVKDCLGCPRGVGDYKKLPKGNKISGWRYHGSSAEAIPPKK